MKELNVSQARQQLPTLVNEASQSDGEAEKAAPSLRGLPIEIAEDFDEPLPELWEAPEHVETIW